MAVFAADDVSYIAQRMREIASDKRAASGNGQETIISPVTVDTLTKQATQYETGDEFLYAVY